LGGFLQSLFFKLIRDFSGKTGSRFSFQNRSLIFKIKSLRDRITNKNQKPPTERKIDP